jgi:hypothetical protein
LADDESEMLLSTDSDGDLDFEVSGLAMAALFDDGGEVLGGI